MNCASDFIKLLSHYAHWSSFFLSAIFLWFPFPFCLFSFASIDRGLTKGHLDSVSALYSLCRQKCLIQKDRIQLESPHLPDGLSLVPDRPLCATFQTADKLPPNTTEAWLTRKTNDQREEISGNRLKLGAFIWIDKGLVWIRLNL